MEIKQIKSALAVAKHLSFSEAGLETAFSTSAVSKHIAALEQELGVYLFLRKGKAQIQLTQEGEVLLPYFQRMADEYDAITRQARALSMSVNAQLAVASPQIFPPNIETELLGEFIRDNPDIDLNVTHYFLGQMIDMLYGGRIDLGMESILGKLEDNPILYRLAGDDDFTTIPVMVRDDYVLLHPDNPLSLRPSLGIADLIEYPGLNFLFVNSYPEKPSIRKSIFLRECNKYNYLPAIIDFNYDHGASALMAKYIGLNPNSAAIMPDLETDYPSTVRVKLRSDAFLPTTIIFYLKSNPSKALKAFIATAKKVGEKYLR
jgi:DNA-binding transcriptional LysR family regulator